MLFFLWDFNILHLFCSSLSLPLGSPGSVQWLPISVCNCLTCWHSQHHVCKHILASAIMSGIGVCYWDGSQGRQSLHGLSFNIWFFVFFFFFCPCFSLEGNNSTLKIFRWVTVSFPHLGNLPIHSGWSLKVLSPLCCTFWIGPSTLSPVSLVNSIFFSCFHFLSVSQTKFLIQ